MIRAKWSGIASATRLPSFLLLNVNFGYVATVAICRIARDCDRAPDEKNEMQTSTAAVLDQSLPPHATRGVLQPAASAPSDESPARTLSAVRADDASAPPIARFSVCPPACVSCRRNSSAADEARAPPSLARELHDGVGAELTATRFALAGVETWLPADAPPQCAAALKVARPLARRGVRGHPPGGCRPACADRSKAASSARSRNGRRFRRAHAVAHELRLRRRRAPHAPAR